MRMMYVCTCTREIGGGGAVACLVVVHWISRIINVRLEDAANLVDLFSIAIWATSETIRWTRDVIERP